jgi:hypothetical protein
MTNCNNPLFQPPRSYPDFQPNQVLSADHLNLLASYLDGQTRSSRLCLLGTGNVCGLIPSWNSNQETLTISAGCGVTSDGYLIQLGNCSYTHCKEVTLNERDLFGQESTVEYQAYRLLGEHIAGAEELGDLDLDPTSMVVLVLLTDDSQGQADCTVDCDEIGKQHSFVPGAYLITSDIADQLLKQTYQMQDLDIIKDLLIGKYDLEDVYLERFGHPFADYQAEDGYPALAEVRSYEIFKERYKTIIDLGKERVQVALQKAQLLFSPLFTRTQVDPLAVDDNFLERFAIDDSTPIGIHQYLYDHLFDLVLAYDELRDAAFDLMDACGISTGRFPRHLLLGTVLKDGTNLPIPPSLYRTPYTQPPVYNGNASRVGTAALLYERLELLIEKFLLPDSGVIRITPSRRGGAPLSERAIPYYYSSPDELRRTWNGDRHRRGRYLRTLGYHFHRPQQVPDNSDPTSPYEDPLVVDFEAQDFFRIEGHIGLEKATALNKISKLRDRYNLPFDVVLLRLGGGPGGSGLLDCEIPILEAAYTKLRTDLQCAIEGSDNPSTFKALAVTLTDTLDTFVYGNFADAFDSVSGGEDCVLGYHKTPFEKLHRLYTERTAAMKSQELFHEFALKHPGMEHKAGVPRGGTFILVYADLTPREEADLSADRLQREVNESVQLLLTEQMRERYSNRLAGASSDVIETLVTQTIEKYAPQSDSKNGRDDSMLAAIREAVEQSGHKVVGDFSLPYLCCSSCPPTSQVVVRARPILLLAPVKFCKSDTGSYPFVVDPPGGMLSSDHGGIAPKGAQFFFEPAATEIDEGPVQVTYSVDGVESMILLHILPAANAGFTGLKGPYCSNDGPVELKPEDPNVESKFEVDGVEGNHLYPEHATFNEGVDRTDVTITHRVIDEITRCPNRSQQTVTVYRAPNAEFEGLDEGGYYCRDEEPWTLTLRPREEGGHFSTNIPEPNVIYFDADAKQWILNLKSIIFTEGQEQLEVEVTHTISKDFYNRICTAESKRQIFVVAAPQATFRIPKHICLQEAPDDEPDAHLVLITLEEGTPAGGDFQAIVNGVVVDGVFEETFNGVYFNPKADGIPRDTPIRIIYRVEDEHGCSGWSEQTTEVHDASFTGLEDSYCSDEEAPELAPGFSYVDGFDSEFKYLVDGATVDEFNPSAVKFSEDPDTAVVEVTHVVHRNFDGQKCHARLTKRTLVHRIRPATFNSIPDHICRRPPQHTWDQRIALIPDEDAPTGKFEGAGVIDEGNGAYFDPWLSDVPLNKDIEISYLVPEDGCNRSTAQTTRVLDAGFSGLRDTYCPGDQASVLEPDHPDGVISQFFVDGAPLDGTRFNPKNISIPDGQSQITVSVTHRVGLNDQDTGAVWECESDPQTTTVVADLPTGYFEMKQADEDASSVRLWIVDIAPQNAGPALAYVFSWTDQNDPPGQKEEVRENSESFMLTVARADLPDGGNFALTLVLRCGDDGEKGPPFTQKISIDWGTDDPEGPGEGVEPAVVATPVRDITELLSARNVRNRESIDAISREYPGISRSNSFMGVDELLKLPPDSPIDDLVKAFGKFVRTQVDSHGRWANGDRSTAYQMLAQTATVAFFDRIATRSLTDDARELVKMQLASLGDIGMELTTLYEKSWLTEDLGAVLDPDQIEAIRSLIG